VGKTEKLTVFVAECQRMGLQILPPDINRSGLSFEPECEGEKPGIRYGLAAIKNVGEMAMETAVEERRSGGVYHSLSDFCSRLDTKRVNKKSVESLVRCGAFDWTGIERAEMFEEIESAMAAAASVSRDRAAGQVSLFDAITAPLPKTKKRSHKVITPWSPEEKLAAEKELLGFYVTGHPLDRYRSLFESGKYVQISKLAEVVEPGERNAVVQIAGALAAVEKRFSKKGNKPFAIVTLEDLSDSVEVMIFGEAYNSGALHIETGKLVAIQAKVEVREDEGVRVMANEVKPLKRPAEVSRPVLLKLSWENTSEKQLLEIRDALGTSPGMRPVLLQFEHKDGRKVRMHAAEQFKVDWQPALEARLGHWLVRD
jgi:DNA polymerase III subunit alpha